MRTSRRALAGIVFLGLLIALVVIQQRGGDAPAVDRVDGRPPIDGGRQTVLAATLATTETPVATSGSADETAKACTQTFNDATKFALLERIDAKGQVLEPGDKRALTELLQLVLPEREVPEPDGEQLEAELRNLQRSLTDARDPESLLAMFLLEPLLVPPNAGASNGRYARTPLLDLGTRAANSNSPLLAWHALRICVDAKTLCPFANLEQRLLDADRQNAEAWALVAELRYRRSDIAGALAAMQGAARAPNSTWYWTETVASIDRSLTAGTSIPYVDRTMTAFGLAAANLPVTPYKMCRVESGASRAWAEACLAFGRLRGERNEAEGARATGPSIREQALTALGDKEGAAEVAAELELLRAERTAGGMEMTISRGLLHQTLISTDPARLHSYLSAVQKSGEAAGVRMFLQQELPPLLERAGLLERDGTRECVARFLQPLVAAGTRAATAGHLIQVADRLLISVSGGGPSVSTTVQVRPDGKITIPRVPDVAAVDKTTGQLEREIATMPPWQSQQSPRVFVILLAPPSREEPRQR